jgi:hypothetical protein
MTSEKVDMVKKRKILTGLDATHIIINRRLGRSLQTSLKV